MPSLLLLRASPVAEPSMEEVGVAGARAWAAGKGGCATHEEGRREACACVGVCLGREGDM